MLRSLLLIMGMFAALMAHAQIFPGYHTSQFAGIHGVPFNPASAAGSRYRWDVNLVGATVNAGNTYAKFDKASLLSGTDTFHRFVDYFPDTAATRKQYGWGSVDLMLPSVLYSIDETQAVAFTWRVRGAVNAGGAQTPTTNFFALNYPNPSYYNRTIVDDYAGGYGQAWNEFGLSYARVLKNDGMHRLKAGITLKYLAGQAAGYAVGRNGNFEFQNRNSVDINSGQMYFAWNEEVSTNEYDGWSSYYKPFQNAGIGADIGLIYEWMPEAGLMTQQMDDDTWNPDADTWKARFGISVVDIGGISYTKAGASADLDVAVQDFDAHQLNRIRGENINTYARRLAGYFTPLETDDKFYMNLPTSINLMGDYNFNDRFFVSASATIGLMGGTKDDNKNHALTQLLITPRYETKYLGAYVPFSVNQYGQADAGLGLRLGPLVLGSASLFSNLMRSQLNHADAFVALRIIPFRFPKLSWDKGSGGIFRNRKKNLGCPPM